MISKKQSLFSSTVQPSIWHNCATLRCVKYAFHIVWIKLFIECRTVTTEGCVQNGGSGGRGGAGSCWGGLLGVGMAQGPSVVAEMVEAWNEFGMEWLIDLCGGVVVGSFGWVIWCRFAGVDESAEMWLVPSDWTLWAGGEGCWANDCMPDLVVSGGGWGGLAGGGRLELYTTIRGRVGAGEASWLKGRYCEFVDLGIFLVGCQGSQGPGALVSAMVGIRMWLGLWMMLVKVYKWMLDNVGGRCWVHCCLCRWRKLFLGKCCLDWRAKWKRGSGVVEIEMVAGGWWLAAWALLSSLAFNPCGSVTGVCTHFIERSFLYTTNAFIPHPQFHPKPLRYSFS